jgi:hypothetical protein
MATTKKAASKTAPKKETPAVKAKEAPKASKDPKAAKAVTEEKKGPKAAAAKPEKAAKAVEKPVAKAPKAEKASKEAPVDAKEPKKKKKDGKKEKSSKAAKDEPKRKLGLRGAAPWAARHAAKHAAEARARAAEPPLPGSARATIRTPAGAEDIKKRIAELHEQTAKIKTLKKNLAKNFFDVGIALAEVQAKKLFEAKGFGTFEAYAERETELGKHEALRLVKATVVFQREAASEYGMDKVFAALNALESDAPESRPSGKIPPPPISTSVLPMRPPGR